MKVSASLFFNQLRKNLPILILLLAFALRFLRLIRFDPIANDGVFYLKSAKLLASGNFEALKETSFFNLYLPFILLFQKVFSDWETSGRFVSAFFGTMTVLPLYLMTRKLIDEKMGLVVAFFYAILPSAVEYSSDVLREPVFWFFFFLCLLTGVTAFLDKKLKLLFFASGFHILAIFTRSEGILAVPIICVWAISRKIRGQINERFLRRFLFTYVFSLAVWSVGLLLLLKLFTSGWETGPLGYKLKQIYFEKTNSQISLEQELLTVAGLSEPARTFIDLALKHIYIIYASEVVYKSLKSLGVIFIPLLIIGIVRKKYRLKDGGDFFFIWILFSLLGSYLHFLLNHYFSTRHALSVSIPSLLWASKGFFELVSVLQEKWGSISKVRLFSMSFAQVIMILIFLVSLPFNFKPVRSDKLELKYAGLCLKDSKLSGKKIATLPHLSRVVFYADAEPVYFKEFKDPLTLSGELEKKGCYLLLLDAKAEKMFTEKKTSKDEVFEKIEVPCFHKLKEYSLSLYRLGSNHVPLILKPSTKMDGDP